jgi:hypothetical protein
MSASGLRICLHVAARAQRGQPRLRIVYHALSAERRRASRSAIGTHAPHIDARCTHAVSCRRSGRVSRAARLTRVINFHLRDRSPSPRAVHRFGTVVNLRKGYLGIRVNKYTNHQT